ncbi:fibrillin-2, partial [Biomphalaria glabrata]
MCYNGLCPDDRTCLNSEFAPVCQDICDFGSYAEQEQCVACDEGQTTLVKRANSRYYCVENCEPGYRLTFDKLTCEPCPQDMYWSDADKTCHVCPYTSYNSTSCSFGEMRSVYNPLINVELNITLWTPKCMRNDTDYFNNIEEKELIRILVFGIYPYT